MQYNNEIPIWRYFIWFILLTNYYKSFKIKKILYLILINNNKYLILRICFIKLQAMQNNIQTKDLIFKIYK